MYAVHMLVDIMYYLTALSTCMFLV